MRHATPLLSHMVVPLQRPQVINETIVVYFYWLYYCNMGFVDLSQKIRCIGGGMCYICLYESL